MNSLVVAIATTVLAVLLSSMMAYAFARFQFPGRRILFGLLLIGLMVPTMMLLIPQFLLAKNLGLLDSLWGLVFFYTGGTLALNTFLLRSFFQDIPRELEEAMVVDGAGPWTRYLEADPAAVAARARDGRDLLLPRELGRVRLGAHRHQRPEQAHAADRDRALPGRALDELGARVRGLVDRVVPVLLVFVDLPAAVRQRLDDGSAEGLMAIATGDLIAERQPRRCCETGQAPSGAFVASPTLPRLPLRLAARRRVLRARARPRRPVGGVQVRGTAGCRRRSSAPRRRAEAAIARRRERRDAAGRRRCCRRGTRSTARSSSEDPDDPWPNFQIDGYGMWLWSLEQHLAGSRCPMPSSCATVELVGALPRRVVAAPVLELLGGVQTAASTRRRSRAACAGLDVGGAADSATPCVRGRSRARSRGARCRATSPAATSGSSPGDARVDSSILLARRPVRGLRGRRPARRRDGRARSSAS